jgi:formate hydrogenlyase subunit 6/NADH:ubiquinone oxidoreductase subunit I
MSDEAIYKEFIGWLKQICWHGVAETDQLVSLVKAWCTAEEAALLTGMPASGGTLEQLAQMKQMDPSELGRKLDAMARKGVMYRSVRGDDVRYRFVDMFFVYLRSAFWPGGTDEPITTIAPLANKYAYEFLDEWADVHHKGLRTVPIEGTVEDPRQVLPYEDVVKIVESRDYWCVTHCACKHRKNIDPDTPECKYPVEVCLHFDHLARYIVDNGLGREITKEETLDILRESAEAGLVHGASTWKERVDTICNCCKCCCMWLETFHVLNHSGSLDPSNYRARVNTEICKGCGLCVKRCPMEALRLEESPKANNKTGKVAVLNRDICIGCGVCAYKCPAEVIVLEEREEIHEPPKDVRDFTRSFIADRKAADARRKKGNVQQTRETASAVDE